MFVIWICSNDSFLSFSEEFEHKIIEKEDDNCYSKYNFTGCLNKKNSSNDNYNLFDNSKYMSNS
jgi:hypothetical protein